MEFEDTSETLKGYIREFDSIFGKYFAKPKKKGMSGSEIPQDEPNFKIEEPTEIVRKPKKHTKEKLKKLYKSLSSKTHPDMGGDEEDFVKIGKYYEDGNIMELISIAEKYDIVYELDDDDSTILETNIKKLEAEVFRMKDTLAWNWCVGDVNLKKHIVKIVESQTKEKIDPTQVIDELKEKDTLKEILKLSESNER